MDSLRVWSRFTVTRKDGTVLKLRIQDMPSERANDVIDFNIEYFVKHEVFHKAAGVSDNPKALEECREFDSEMKLDETDHVTICCLDGPDGVVGDLLGVSSMSYSTKDDEDFDIGDIEFKTEEMRKFFEFIDVQISLYDTMKEQNVDKILDGRGMAVHPDYRGLGIATEFLKIRSTICKERNVPITVACMTSLGSQKAAERAGWETVFQVPFLDLEERLGVTFDGAPPYLKIMLARVS
ncbi:arylalkylamine N-acetyltransferase 1-like [Pectinophora gossypiella]|uniref:arylalkylamine N-acetyltransferase 1-like n=1 Tax=Pectinophora gossypiella TaxID=13191 RepID=UPI00214EB7CF|nr:arylalkylamine N-acetyltransferase 1-like [Pectinophora gossypiella]